MTDDFSDLFSPSGEHNAPLDHAGRVEGSITVKGHIPGTDPATDLAMLADGWHGDVDPRLAAAINAVLARLERAESIAKAATAYVSHRRCAEGLDFAREYELFDALAREVRDEH